MIFGKLDAADFLARYWQKKPLLLRGAVAGFSDPITPDELAGLACEPEVESRLVLDHGDSRELRNGPFREDDFAGLPETGWTLLVQGVDSWFESVKNLLELVEFIPSWRIDDVMVSYASPGGGCVWSWPW